MKTPDRFVTPIVDALPFLTAESFDHLGTQLQLDSALPTSVWQSVRPLLWAVDEAINASLDRNQAMKMRVGDLLGWDE